MFPLVVQILIILLRQNSPWYNVRLAMALHHSIVSAVFVVVAFQKGFINPKSILFTKLCLSVPFPYKHTYIPTHSLLYYIIWPFTLYTWYIDLIIIIIYLYGGYCTMNADEYEYHITEKVWNFKV